MKKSIYSILLFFLLCSEVNADVCLLMDEKTAKRSLEILQSEQDVFDYCSTCETAEPIKIKINNINLQHNGNFYTVQINGKALDMAHTYYLKDNKYFNVAIEVGCEEAIKYNFSATLSDLPKIRKLSQEKTTTDIQKHIDKITELCEKQFFQKQTYSVNYAIEAAQKSNNCIAEQIQTEIEKIFDEEERAHTSDLFNQLRDLSKQFYTTLYYENKYCAPACGLNNLLYVESEQTNFLQDILRNILITSAEKAGF